MARACRVAGLATGPVHAEARVNEHGIWLLEIAARSIGGLCGRVLTHSLGMSLEEMILRPLVGKPLPEPLALVGEGGAAGVMMIPIPRRGIYHGLQGLAAAQSVAGVTGVTITAEPGQIVAPPPDGASYLGFIFARASIPAEAEAALRIAHRSLNFDSRPCEIHLHPVVKQGVIGQRRQSKRRSGRPGACVGIRGALPMHVAYNATCEKAKRRAASPLAAIARSSQRMLKPAAHSTACNASPLLPPSQQRSIRLSLLV